MPALIPRICAALLALAVVAATAAFLPRTARAQTDEPPPRIAFARSAGTTDEPGRYEIFTISPDGSDVVRLTRNNDEDSFPSFSPDGRFIAFTRTRFGTSHLYVMDANGGNVRRLTNGTRSDALPDWSPDGRWIVFTRNFDNERQSDLFKIRSNGETLVRLTDTAAREFAPEWSPDGELVAYSKFVQRKSRFGIAVMRPDGRRRRWLVVNPRSHLGNTDYNPTWSPTGKRVAFSREDRDLDVDVFTVRRDGTGVRRLTDLGSEAQNPTWSADGPIAFMLGRSIAVMNRDGSGLHRITPSQRGDASPRPYSCPDWASVAVP